MFSQNFDIEMKILLGEEVTDEERNRWNNRNLKYEIVRYIYLEKMHYDKTGLVDFHFTPDQTFDDTPIIDLVNRLIKLDEDIRNGNIKVETLDFGDSKWVVSDDAL